MAQVEELHARLQGMNAIDWHLSGKQHTTAGGQSIKYIGKVHTIVWDEMTDGDCYCCGDFHTMTEDSKQCMPPLGSSIG